MNNDSELVLVLAPTENDSSVAVKVLQEAGITAYNCRFIDDLCNKIQDGCAVIVIAEEALPTDQLPQLHSMLKSQETWSDIPVILLTGEGPARSWESFSASGNISILERPFSRLTLTRSVEVGLRARRKQYQVRHLLEQQQRAAQKRDEFFATLSHELRTPLNVILGWIEIFRTDDLTAVQRFDALATLDRNARIQKALIDDLLDTSRIITGKLHFEMTSLSLKAALLSAQKAFAPRMEEKGLTMQMILPSEECLVMADEQRLSQVISNLITNSIKFTPEKGTITIRLSKDSENYTVSVKDNGQGISPDFLPYVFDRLKQEDMSTTRSHGGLGLGLAITAHIVEQHKGHIEAKSLGHGKGAEFIFTLPVPTKPIQLSTSQNEIIMPPDSLLGVRVLVVDDSPDILDLVNLWLKKAHAEVKLTSSAAEALRELDKYQPDILLSDIGMPEMDGYELITRVRALKQDIRNVRAVALTAYAKDEERTRALKAGFQMHISKPISYNQLISSVALLARTENQLH